VHASTIPGAGFANFAVLAGVFVTAFYSFRMYFMVFHGEERFGKAHAHDGHGVHDVHAGAHAPAAKAAAGHDAHGHDAHGHDAHGHGSRDPHESDAHHEEEDHAHHGLAPGEKPHEAPWVVTLPLILLAIPSVLIGYFTISPMLHGSFFNDVIFVAESHKSMEILREEFHGAMAMAIHGLSTMPFWLALGGVAAAYYCYMINPRVPAWFYAKFRAVHTLLDNKYYLDRLNEIVFAAGSMKLGRGLWNVGDRGLIDGLIVNGSAKMVGWFSLVTRTFQTGYIYHYAFTMILGIVLYLGYLLLTPYIR
jgi:NADH-quinone oxidoreductase subunit L